MRLQPMEKYTIFVLFILLSISLYGQEVEQEYGREFTMNNTQPVDNEKKCTEVVNEIDSIRLRCDTISISHCYGNKYTKPNGNLS